MFVIPAARRRAMSSSTVARLCRRPNGCGLGIHKGLHAEADAVHAASQQRVQNFRAPSVPGAHSTVIPRLAARKTPPAPQSNILCNCPAFRTVGVPPPR